MAYRDIEDSRAAIRKHYNENKGYYKGKARRRRHEMRDWLRDYKQEQGCKDCGISNPVVLVFHHINPEEKDFNLCNAPSFGYGIERVSKEIEKCIVLCANCHAIVHASE